MKPAMDVRRYLLTYVLTCTTIIFFNGCSESTVVQEDAASKSTVIGYARLSNNFYIVNDYSGIEIILTGTKHKTQTDSSGKWVLEGVERGVYTIEFSKPGYLTQKGFNVLVSGNGVLYYYDEKYRTGNLFPLPDYLKAYSLVLRQFDDVTIDSILYPHSNTTFSFSITMEQPDSALNEGDPYYATLFFSKSPNISPADRNSYNLTSGLYNGVIYRDSVHNASIKCYYNNFIDNGYKSGDTVYCSGWVIPAYLYQYYFEPDYNEYARVGYSKYHTEEKSFILP